MNDIQHPSPEALPSVQQQRIEAVWRERAHRLSQRPDLTGIAQDAVPVVVLGIGKERYGIDLQDVAEVFPPVLPTPVPGAAPVVAGVINVHGEIRPVIDLGRLLGIDKAANGVGLRVILLRKDGREMGLQIDSVEHIRWITSGDRRTEKVEGSVQGPVQGSAQVSAHIRGSTKDLLMLLSTEALFAELDRGVNP
jgi:chemotaxis signal transduction protein